MASFIVRDRLLCLPFRAIKTHKLLNPSSTGPGAWVQVASITAPANQTVKVVKPKPWPYKKREYTLFWQYFDTTSARLDENSKVIVVEGNMAVGKSKFAQQLAKELDFHYVPMVAGENVYQETAECIDRRELDMALPDEYKTYDLKKFYNDPNPENGRSGRLQLEWYITRLFSYAEGLTHLFSTGQGVVFDRSVFSDNVYAEALRRSGFLKPEALRYYNENRRISICELFKPHLTIYLDAPVGYIMDQIKKRNIDYEVNSKVVSEKYVQEIDNAFKNIHLPYMKRQGEVLAYDAQDLDEWEVIVEDIERLNLDKDLDDEDKFMDWHIEREDDWAFARRRFCSKAAMASLFRLPPPWESPEIMPSTDEIMAVEHAMKEYQRGKYSLGYNKGDSLLGKLFDFNISKKQGAHN